MRELRNNAEPSIWSEGRALLIIAPLFSLMFLYQNCAPANVRSREMSSAEPELAVEMSKVAVYLQHDSQIDLAEVELVADDVVTGIDEVPGPGGEVMPISKTGAESIRLSATQASGTSYILDLPRGAQKIIVARAKTRDPITNAVATYYGNVIMTADHPSDEVTIRLVAIP